MYTADIRFTILRFSFPRMVLILLLADDRCQRVRGMYEPFGAIHRRYGPEPRRAHSTTGRKRFSLSSPTMTVVLMSSLPSPGGPFGARDYQEPKSSE